MSRDSVVNVAGAGLAGCECALQLATRGIKVNLYECKKSKKSPAHTSDNFGELVCSNSLKSNDRATASGLLKEELRILKSCLIEIADKNSVPAGNALAVDREKFSLAVTKSVCENPLINVIEKEFVKIDTKMPTVIATGPLTSEVLADEMQKLLGEQLHFYDAAAPIIAGDSIDMKFAFTASRYGKGSEDYVNCTLDKEQYYRFVDELVKAERAELHEFEKGEIFESCMPVEIMAARGIDTLRFGPLKPVGFTDPNTGRRPYAVIQLRKENTSGSMYNIVGFQTNLKFNEQKRVFSLIPALRDAEYLRFGVMHRNSFINAPETINGYFQCKKHSNIFIAGQLSGVEGYVESIASGLVCAINIERMFEGKDLIMLPVETIIGALSRYLSQPNSDFQPMNANFGILPPLQEVIRDKQQRKIAYTDRAVKNLLEFSDINELLLLKN